MEKYPDRLMKAMAYFEFFYMNELKNNKKTLERFESNYPNVLNYKNNVLIGGSDSRKDGQAVSY